MIRCREVRNRRRAFSVRALRRRLDGKEEKMKKIALVSVLALFFGSLALAQSPSGPPKPAPELANAKYLVGTWSCTGEAPESPFGPAHKTETTVMMKPDLDGFWIDGTVTEKKTASNPHPVKGMVHVGYDSAAKQFVMLWIDNFGARSTETSPGWEGDTLNFSGEMMMMGENTPVKDTFVKKGANELTHRGEMSMKGENHMMVEETCKRRK
jgi:Protein of unknown function (DUF1579)